jgi:hypothetical protein
MQVYASFATAKKRSSVRGREAEPGTHDGGAAAVSMSVAPVSGPGSCFGMPRNDDHTCRAIIIFLISAMALAGFSPFGQVLAQFMMVWQR